MSLKFFHNFLKHNHATTNKLRQKHNLPNDDDDDDNCKDDDNTQLDSTHRVQTHAKLLYPNHNPWPFNPTAMSNLGYPKVIHYSKF